jgi:tRNA nucleotidyltransferase/poly(A) polymerase
MIDDDTFNALERNADRIKIISGERIVDELNKIMLTNVPSKDSLIFIDAVCLRLIIPELSMLGFG